MNLQRVRCIFVSGLHFIRPVSIIGMSWTFFKAFYIQWWQAEYMWPRLMIVRVVGESGWRVVGWASQLPGLESEQRTWLSQHSFQAPTPSYLSAVWTALWGHENTAHWETSKTMALGERALKLDKVLSDGCSFLGLCFGLRIHLLQTTAAGYFKSSDKSAVLYQPNVRQRYNIYRNL